MKKISLFIIGTLITVGLFAQKNDSTLVIRTQEFGIHAGATTGVGLSYRYWPKKFGIQVTMLPIKTDDQTFFSVGLTGLYSFYNSRVVRFFGYLGSNLTIDNHKNYYDYNYDPITGEYSYNDIEKSTKCNMGFGPGFGFGTRVRINIMAGYGFYDIFGKFNIYPTGEVGLYFRL
jgi:hypothetical protein